MKVVCICYDGSEISDKTVNSIVAIVSTFAKDKSKVLVNRYGDKDIADALSVLSSKVVCFKTAESSVGEAVKKQHVTFTKDLGRSSKTMYF